MTLLMLTSTDKFEIGIVLSTAGVFEVSLGAVDRVVLLESHPIKNNSSSPVMTIVFSVKLFIFHSATAHW